jgi:hypothetical protein
MKRRLQTLSALACFFSFAVPLRSQMPEHQHHPGMEMPKDPTDRTDPSDMHSMHSMMPGMLGPYGMSREASGTAWQPESAPHTGIHTLRGGWHLMAHGFVNLLYDDQGGARGETKSFSENMLMGMATRELGSGRLGLRAMLSAEPWTIGRGGYPLLLQTGETADGVHPLVDHQHPHDLFMELAATYSVPLGKDSSAFIYLGLPGEPALGPATYMHRFSGMDNPEAPLGHHWLDSTHITYGVATLGWTRGGFKLEGSSFTGREPDEQRDNIESPKMDSWSVRATWNPTPDWSFQISRGHLKSPEQLEPESDVDRTTASAMWNHPLAAGNWQTTFAWGRNARDPGTTTDSFLLESAVTLGERHTLFGRVEQQENDELTIHGDNHGDEVVDVGKLSAGYIWDGVRAGSFRGGLGLLGSVSRIPGELKHEYGSSPFSWMAFLRAKI